MAEQEPQGVARSFYQILPIMPNYVDNTTCLSRTLILLGPSQRNHDDSGERMVEIHPKSAKPRVFGVSRPPLSPLRAPDETDHGCHQVGQGLRSGGWHRVALLACFFISHHGPEMS